MLPRDSPTLITTDPESFRPTVEGREPVLPEWIDLDEATAREWVQGGGSLMLAGLPGTGKSHLVQEWLRELPGRKIHLTAPTHVAARNLRVEAWNL